MKSIQIKDAVALHNPAQEEITILGGQQEFKDQELKEVAEQFGITSYETRAAEVRSGSKESKFEYFHYTLVYGSKSPFFEKSLLN